MPAPFKQLTREQFAALLDKIELKRRINAVHMHHTWRPNHSQYDKSDGHKTILGMYLYHTQVKKWQDIAQHITIAPDGTIWSGRNWNLPPVSASGHNGNSVAGPFMFEIIGDFDEGGDRFEGEQRKTVLEVIARVQKKWGLAPETLKFHNAMSSKSCPGSAVRYDEFIDEVRVLRQQLDEPAPTPRAATRTPKPPFAPDAQEINQIVEDAIDALGREIPPATDPADAEHSYQDVDDTATPLATPLATPSSSPGRPAARASGLGPQMLAALRPHLINLNLGKFSSDGEWKTERGDVDAIFDQHLGRALQEAAKRNEPLRIVFFAHGGLVKESTGLEIAYKQLDWWRKNNIYPIYFVWETGLFETIGQLLTRSQQGTRNFISDHISDPLLEKAARALQGPRIWGGMKLAAEYASATADAANGEGGARYAAIKLKAFCDANKKVELHAVGHSAGSIFHAHFLAAAGELKAPSFKTAHFLAPAIEVDVFKKLLMPRVGPGKGVDHLSVFTMARDYERDDHCAQVYRKSLLYLVYHALEREPETAILGLEQSLRADAEMKALFGLDSTKLAAAELVLSVSAIGKGKSASTATTHGGFDDDGATMNSVMRRILGKADADRIVEYPVARGGARAFDSWSDQVDWPQRISDSIPPAASQQTRPQPSQQSIAPGGRAAGSGRKRALCIGINQYSAAPLNGCVADAEEWARTFTQLGFATTLLRDAEATRDTIINQLDELVRSSAAGDVVAFQFAGHGTQFPDNDGDEAPEDTPDKDEALCPFDYAAGAYVIDDDLREIFARLGDGVNLTVFTDCCHSGTISRFAVGADPSHGAPGGDQRARFLPASDAMQQMHRQFREQKGGARAVSPGRQAMKNIAFSACRSEQVAWESGGHGDFTVRAIRILRGGIDGLSNEQFAQRMLVEFGVGARQEPQLDCPDHAAARGLLQPLSANGGAPSGIAATPEAALSRQMKAETIQTLQGLIQRLRG
ncbi:MAG: caspase family protein [Burkholderiales bacterium]|nr:caspase family protein [Burkholderiales bacterium]